MFLSDTPQPTAPTQLSYRSASAEPILPEHWEDGCSVRQAPLRIADRGMWFAFVVLAGATAWLMA